MTRSTKKFVKQFDFLGVETPQINIDGETKVRTHIGSLISVIIGVLTCVFALIKLEHLANRKNPSLTSNHEAND